MKKDELQHKLGIQHDFMLSAYEHHPEEFQVLSEDELRVIGEVYFVGRDIDVDSVDEYIASKTNQDPEIIKTLNAATTKIADTLQIPEESKHEMLLKDEAS